MKVFTKFVIWKYLEKNKINKKLSWFFFSRAIARVAGWKAIEKRGREIIEGQLARSECHLQPLARGYKREMAWITAKCTLSGVLLLHSLYKRKKNWFLLIIYLEIEYFSLLHLRSNLIYYIICHIEWKNQPWAILTCNAAESAKKANLPYFFAKALAALDCNCWWIEAAREHFLQTYFRLYCSFTCAHLL